MAEFHNDLTLFKVHDVMVKWGLDSKSAMDLIRELLNEGVLFRQIAPSEAFKDERPHSRACGMKLVHEHGFACAKDCPTCLDRSQIARSSTP